MNDLALILLGAVPIGLGATLSFDLWALFLKHAFKLPPSTICLIGRWIRYMPDGTFRHSNIALTPPKSAECAVGWIAHYTIGVTFATAFVVIAGDSWLQHPTPIPAIVFGVVTVLAPLFIMQPSFGLGLAASKTSSPALARLRSLMNHIAFGGGLYLVALLVSWLVRIYAK